MRSPARSAHGLAGDGLGELNTTRQHNMQETAPSRGCTWKGATEMRARVVLPIVMIIALLALAPSSTLASGEPTHQPVPNSFYTFTIPAGMACTFAVGWEPVVNNEVVTTFPPEANGDVAQLFTGYVLERFTNLDNGKSIVINISGPATFVHHTDGSITYTGLGPEPVVFFPTDIPAGPKFYINYGQIIYTITPSGQAILVSQSGTQFNVCAALS